MIKWPEPKEITNQTGKLDTEYCKGYNAAREACIKAYEQEPKSLPTVEEIESIITGIMFPEHGVGYRYSVCINTAKAIHELLTKGEK